MSVIVDLPGELEEGGGRDDGRFKKRAICMVMCKKRIERSFKCVEDVFFSSCA